VGDAVRIIVLAYPSLKNISVSGACSWAIGRSGARVRIGRDDRISGAGIVSKALDCRSASSNRFPLWCNILAKLYFDRARRVELEDMAKLWEYFECSLGDLFETAR
jgi:hypothetical protein